VSHDGAPLAIAVTGAGLSAVTSATVLTGDTTWTIPLTIVAQTDSTLTATGEMSQALLGASLQLATGATPIVTAPLRDDAVFEPPDSLRAGAHLRNFYDPEEPRARPKDFAFFANTVWVPPPAGVGWERVLHVFAIRHLDTRANDDDNENVFLHAWWREDGVCRAWKSDTTAFRAGGTAWDGLHVWAPSMVFRGGRYVMFYTGVDSTHAQRIGYATTASIDTSDTGDVAWQRHSTPVFAVEQAGWTAKRAPPQCRDPFVFANPDGPGLLMVYAALDSATGAMAVGLAKCPSGLDAWSDAGHFIATDGAHSRARRLESPLVLADSASRAIAASLGIPLGEVPGVTWRLFYTDGDYVSPDSSVRFVMSSSALTDTSLAAWSQPGPTSLHSYTSDGPFVVNVRGLGATECATVGGADLLAGFQGFVANGDTLIGIAFRRVDWPANPEFVLSDSAGVRTSPSRLVTADGIALLLAELIPGRGSARFTIETPTSTNARVVVYDVMGRAVRRLFDRVAPAGATPVSWDGYADSGRIAESGVYFVRLSAGGRSRTLRVPLFR